nr:MAG TPA: hypothetical protein [Caudoviricetes sp.]DAL53650.1 MAG TPA_asm: hypothetical protein [Bacteriophage sp.]
MAHCEGKKMSKHSSGNNNKKLIIAIIVIIIIASIGICLYLANQGDSESATSSLTSNIKQSQSNLNIDDFIKKLEEANLKIDNKINKSAELIGAKEGYGLEINGEYIEIYLYNTNSKEELTKSNIKSAKEKGIITMPSFDNYEMKAVYNKGLVLTGYEEHINKDKILKVFNNL